MHWLEQSLFPFCPAMLSPSKATRGGQPSSLEARGGGASWAVVEFVVSAQAGVAQLVEQLIRNQQVVRSTRIAGSKILSKTRYLFTDDAIRDSAV